MKNKIDFEICNKEGTRLEEKQTKGKDLMTIQTAIKYAKVSIYALKDSKNEITPREIEKEMKLHNDRYNDKMVSLLLKAYEQEEKKKW